MRTTSSSVSAVGDKPTAARLRVERQKKRIDAEAKRRLKTADELHAKLDPRGFTSQTGQALLDLMYVMLTQLVADVADIKGQLLDMEVADRPRPLSEGEAERRRVAKIERLKGVVARYTELRAANPTMKQSVIASLMGMSEGALSTSLSQAKAMGVEA